ncbi:MAG: head GIN domain-containing protein, partial [Bacteroidota bacterium]
MKTTQLKITFLIGIFLLLNLFAFSQEISEMREVNEFSSIKAGSIFKIEYSTQDNYSLEINTDQEILEDIQTEVSKGILNIDMKGSARNREVKIKITSPTLTGIDLSGASSFKSVNSISTDEFSVDLSGATNASIKIETNDLSSRISGASNFQVSGKAVEHISELSGAAQLRAANLETQTTNIKTSGAAYARVLATDTLIADASGTSKISFDNQPDNQSFNTSGMGNINGFTKENLDNSMEYDIDENGDTTKIQLGNRDLIIVEDKENTNLKVHKKKKSFRDNW